MRRRIITVIAAIAIGCTAVLAGPGVSSAATRTVSDPQGDATAAADVVRMTVTNARVMKVQLKTRSFGPEFVYIDFTARLSWGYDRIFVSRGDAGTRVRYLRCDADGKCWRHRCREASVRFDRDRRLTTALIPRRCYARRPFPRMHFSSFTIAGDDVDTIEFGWVATG